MYSKYLDYTQAATKAHHSAQGENQQKDFLISQLKAEVYQLRQLEDDFLKLTDLIRSLEDKYSLLLADKDRCEKQQRFKSDLDKNSYIELRETIDDIRVQLQKANLTIDELLRDNTNIKRACDSRGSEVQTIKYQIKDVQNKNLRSNDQNRSLAITVKGLKQQRKRLQEECDTLSGLLDSNIAKLKSLEKEVRNSESLNAKLEKTLYQAEKDNSKLENEIKQKTDECKKGENKIKGVQNSLQELNISYKNIQQQASKNKGQLERTFAQMNNEMNKGKEIQNKIFTIEAGIRAQQNELDVIINQEEKLRKYHFASLDKNKQLNTDIDKILSLISEYELVNKELIDQIEIYIDQDEQAKSMLSRRQIMKDIIEGTLRKIAVTEDPIRHLKC